VGDLAQLIVKGGNIPKDPIKLLWVVSEQE
jgi:hypothetical protein